MFTTPSIRSPSMLPNASHGMPENIHTSPLPIHSIPCIASRCHCPPFQAARSFPPRNGLVGVEGLDFQGKTSGNQPRRFLSIPFLIGRPLVDKVVFHGLAAMRPSNTLRHLWQALLHQPQSRHRPLLGSVTTCSPGAFRRHSDPNSGLNTEH